MRLSFLKNLAVVNEFIAHGLESSSANEKNSKGFSELPTPGHHWFFRPRTQAKALKNGMGFHRKPIPYFYAITSWQIIV
ncbi:hypothetical protein CULC22_02085 [Corynebacterium ulcerans BR-AD22]|nr:hypothetical protein CULC22_02085 [Corynebacterium ulcerans BR-AD22]